MLFPIRTDRPTRRTPVATHGLIIANMAVYLAGLLGFSAGWLDQYQLIEWGRFDPERFRLWQLFTYQFLHSPIDVEASAGSNIFALFHLAFNMYFLWFFGSAVEDRLGRVGYLAFYLLGGAAAGIAHMLFESNPVIGASGSVAAVTGAFAALFPRARVQVVFLFFFLYFFTISALWCVLFYIGVDMLFQLSALLGGDSSTAHFAHLGGYAYGFAVGVTLLGTGILKREDFDLFYLIKQARRRSAFRGASREKPAGIFDSATADTGRRLEQRRKIAPPPTEADFRLAAGRTEISRLVDGHELDAAAAKYRALRVTFPEAVLNDTRQLDVANQIYAESDWDEAAAAYELFLSHFPRANRADEVRLILGLIYARHRPQPARARELLSVAGATLRDPAQRDLATTLLAELEGTDA